MSPEVVWDALVESKARPANTTTSGERYRHARLRLRSEPSRHYLSAKPRSIPALKPELRSAIRSLVAGESPWPLLLHGAPGTGKTCAALCLLDHAGGLYFAANELADKMIAAAQGRLKMPTTDRQCYPENLWSEIASTALLVLDELGSREKVSDFSYDTIKRAVDEREGKPLVVICNHALPRLGELYDERLVSRLAAGTVLCLTGPDRRIERA